jgi:hypothetical protein
MISAWEVMKKFREESVEHCLRNAVNAAAVLDRKEVDLMPLALRAADRTSDPAHKAGMLAKVSRVLSESGRPGEALEVLLLALVTASLAERDTMKKVLADGALALASCDDGRLLRELCLELDRIDSWFGGK